MKTRWNWNRWPIALAVFLFAASPALAHEKWFVDEYAQHIPPPALFRQVTPFGAALVLLALAVMLGFWWYERKILAARHPRFLEKHVERVHVHARVVLCVTLGALLMGSGLQHQFFAPNLMLPDTIYGNLLALVEISLGALFIFMTPYFAELGACLLLLYLAGLFSGLPLHDWLEDLMYVGVAIFLITSETIRLPWKRWNTPERARRGYHAMRILVALNFFVLASVKWLRPDLAMTLVDQYHLNFLAPLGLDTTHFVFMAAVVETFIASAILFKVAMRPAIALAFTFFMLTIYFLGFRELLGHLPIKSTLFILFLLDDWKKGEKRIIR